MNKNVNLFQKPNLQFLLLAFSLWLVSVSLTLCSMTDLFKQSPLQGEYSILWLLIIFSTLVIAKLTVKYFKTQ